MIEKTKINSKKMVSSLMGGLGLFQARPQVSKFIAAIGYMLVKAGAAMDDYKIEYFCDPKNLNLYKFS